MPNLISLGFDKFKKVYVIPSQLTLHRSQAQLGPPSKVQRHRAHPLNREQVRPPPNSSGARSPPAGPAPQQHRNNSRAGNSPNNSEQAEQPASGTWHGVSRKTPRARGPPAHAAHQQAAADQATRTAPNNSEQAEQPASGTWHGVSRKTPRARGPPAHAAHQQAAADQATRTAPNNSEQAQQPASGTWHGVSRSPPGHVVHQRTQPTSEQQQTRQHEQQAQRPASGTWHGVSRSPPGHVVHQRTQPTSRQATAPKSKRGQHFHQGSSTDKPRHFAPASLGPNFESSPQMTHQHFLTTKSRCAHCKPPNTFLKSPCTRESNYGASVLLKLLKWLEGLSTWKTGLAHAFSVRVLLMHTVEALSQVAVRIIAISECSERH